MKGHLVGAIAAAGAVIVGGAAHTGLVVGIGLLTTVIVGVAIALDDERPEEHPRRGPLGICLDCYEVHCRCAARAR
jgi:hypothetical protein